MDRESDHCLELYFKKQLQLIQIYFWLIESFLAEFFIENHWNKIPPSWQKCLKQLSVDEFHDLISHEKQNKKFSVVLPLSLQSFVASCHYLALERKQRFQPSTISNDDAKLPHSFRKHVKVKKQYEVMHLSELIKNVADDVQCSRTVDVGGGLGHLSRYLAFVHKLEAVTIESEGHHKASAEKFDNEALRDIKRSKRKGNLESLVDEEIPPIHVTKMIPLDIQPAEFVRLVMSAKCSSLVGLNQENKLMASSSSPDESHVEMSSTENDKEDSFVLVGLHTCGDLSPSLLRTFVNCKDAKGIVLVGCCYMKLTWEDINDTDRTICSKRQDNLTALPVKDDSNNEPSSCIETKYDHERSKHTVCPCSQKGSSGYGFPMSNFLCNQKSFLLGWNAFELACHNLDNYCQRLKDEKRKLKIQCYRAALEVVIRALRADVKNPQIRCQRIKGAHEMSFEEYSHIALKRIDIASPSPEFYEELKIDPLLSRWKEVVMFYCLRLLLGPVIESMILVDRLLYLRENGLAADLCPVFDSKISPRNFALVASKAGFKQAGNLPK